jgi:hypothetical protein
MGMWRLPEEILPELADFSFFYINLTVWGWWIVIKGTLHSSISSGGPSGKPNQRQNSWCSSISWLQFMQTPLNSTFPQSKVQASLNTSLRFSQCGHINLQIII